MINSNFSIFQPLGLQDIPTLIHLTRCLNDGEQRGFSILFSRVEGGYQFNNNFYTDDKITRQIVEWEDNGELVTFTFITYEDLKGYAITRTKINETFKL